MDNFKFCIYSYNDKTEGEFIWENPSEKLFDLYYYAAEIYECGSYDRAISKYRYILKKDSSFFPALSDIGWSFVQKGKITKAIEYYKKALEIAELKIPINFNGIIDWGRVYNRHYLRTLHGLGLACFYGMKYEEALGLFSKILNYNPNDNQGIRYLMGDLYFILGKNDKAEQAFKENIDKVNCRYSYGLLLFNHHRYTESIIQFSLSVIESEYFYKILLNDRIIDEINVLIADQINHAREYYKLTFNLWYKSEGLDFLFKIYNSDLFKLYYNEIKKIRYKLDSITGVTITDINKRANLLRKLEELINTIDSDFALKLFNEINRIT